MGRSADPTARAPLTVIRGGEPDPVAPPDETLIRRVQRGDREALGELYRRHAVLVRTVAYALTPGLSRADLDDLVQDVFLAVADAARRYRERGKARAWIVAIAARTARQRRRVHAIRSRLFAVFARERAEEDRSAPSADGTIAALDLVRLLERIDPTPRQVVLLFECGGLTGEEIAELLGMPLNTVWSHLRRGRQALLEAYRDDGPAVPPVEEDR
ncbi:MAG: RNA polymerase sigma factor [Deltaproteobacteria bacterium]|nr:RNA polymerase sigma factor [Deltaproteobacteria bacterium]